MTRWRTLSLILGATLCVLVPHTAQADDVACAYIYGSNVQQPSSIFADVVADFVDNGGDCWFFGPNSPYNAYFYSYYGGRVTINTPSGVPVVGYEAYYYGTYAYAEVTTSGNPGNYSIVKDVTEYLCDVSWGCIRGDWSEGPIYLGVAFGIALQASAYTVSVGDPVMVWAELSDPDAAPQLNWSGCAPQTGNLDCLVDTSTEGPHEVVAWIGQFDDAVVINVQQEPPPGGGGGPPPTQFIGTLRVFLLDKNEQLNATNPLASDRAAQFVPGARFSDGVSLPLLEQAQEVDIVAAFVGQNGQVVPPPTGVNSVTLSLTQTTIWIGKAMNDFSGDFFPDYGLGTNPLNRLQSVVVSFSSNQARASLSVYDYGGMTKVRAVANTGGYQSDLIGLPANVPGGDDGDQSSDNGNHGDSLSDFEEWRGFIINGFHTRTNPAVKDLFFYHTDFTLGLYGGGFAADLGVTLHQLTQSDIDNNSWINFNSPNGAGGETPGHRGTKAIRIEEGGVPLCNDANVCPFGDWIAVQPNNQYYLNNTQLIRIFTRTIRRFSPFSPSEFDSDAVDGDKTRQTIAHEIGHAITVSGNLFDEGHVDVSWINCPVGGSQRTVMVSGYHVNTFNEPQPNKICAWNDIPTRFRDVERQNFRLR